MNRRTTAIGRYAEAAELLPERLRCRAMQLPSEEKEQAEEFRLRAGRPMMVVLPRGERVLEIQVEQEDLEALCNLATECSRYTSAETIREGYLSVRGGFRVGLCGTAVMKGGENTNLRELSGAAVRIAREKKGIAEELARQLTGSGALPNTLILSPPGGGKTTLLRDLIRCLSDGVGEIRPRRVALIDERGEVAVMYRGIPQMDVGCRTDVLDACPKALGIPMVLRAMNPELIAVDEITVPSDRKAVAMAAGCGVALLATIHAACPEELRQRPLYAGLLDDGIFQKAIVIRREQGRRSYHLEALPCGV